MSQCSCMLMQMPECSPSSPLDHLVSIVGKRCGVVLDCHRHSPVFMDVWISTHLEPVLIGDLLVRPKYATRIDNHDDFRVVYNKFAGSRSYKCSCRFHTVSFRWGHVSLLGGCIPEHCCMSLLICGHRSRAAGGWHVQITVKILNRLEPCPRRRKSI